MSGPRSDVRLSRNQWDRMWRNTYNHIRFESRWSQGAAMREATLRMERVHGPRPDDPKPPWAVRWIGRKLLGLLPSEVYMSPLVKKLVTSVVFGVGAIAIGFQAAIADGVISGDEWPALVSAFVAAFWGKFSSNTTFVAPSRQGETIAGPGK